MFAANYDDADNDNHPYVFSKFILSDIDPWPGLSPMLRALVK